MLSHPEVRKTEVQAAARDLHAEFVKGRAADGGVMLKGKAEIARLVQTGARAGILTEDLILRSGGKAGHERGETPTRRNEWLPLLQT